MNRITIEEMKEAARRRGGECLSEFYVNCKIKLKWRCSKGHEWMAPSPTIKGGSWCARCGRKEIPFERLLDVAHSRGGKVVSPREEYVNGSSLVEWECARGHRWKVSSLRAHRGSWCPECSPIRVPALEEMHDLARARGGECLSKKYVNSITPLRWRCANGHTWMAPANRVKVYGHAKKGHWCPQCYRDRQRKLAGGGG